MPAVRLRIYHHENMSVLEPHFYVTKLGYAGVYLFFLFLLQNIDCGYSLEPPRRGGSNEYPQSMFWSKNKKNIKNFQLNFSIFKAKKSLCIAWASFRNVNDIFLNEKETQYEISCKKWIVP